MNLRKITYFVLQRLRGGVDRSMIRRARHILDSSESERRRYIENRFKALYGPDAKDLGWLRKQPILDRADVPTPSGISKSVSSDVALEKRHTSGSSGEPLELVRDRQMTAWMDAAMWAVYSWHGVRPGQRQARFWGVPLDPVGRWKTGAKDILLGRRRLNAFELTPERCLDFFTKLERFEPTHAYAYPRMLHEFVQICSRKGLDGAQLSLQVVITTGELLTKDMRANIKEFFECPVVDEYGCSESGILAIECEAGTMHTVPVAAYLEVLNEKNQPVEVGGAGEAVVTDLYGRAGPLLRYRLGDHLIREGQIDCKCGRDLPAVSVQKGRTGCFVRTPSGGLMDSAIFMYAVPEGVRKFRARQVALDKVEVDVVPGEEFEDNKTLQICKRRWESALGGGVEVSVRTVGTIDYDPSGKFTDFVPLND